MIAANFAAFLSHLNIPVSPARVTFGLSRDNGKFEWSSTSLSTFFVQRSNLFSLDMWRMLFDIWRFNIYATDILDPEYSRKDESVGSYLQRNQYSASFQNDYLIPLVSSLWIHDPQETLNSIPIIMIVRYLWNHQLLQIFQSSLQWLLVDGGAKQYVEAILEDIPQDRLHRSTCAKAVRSEGIQLTLELEDGSIQYFDRVIIATRATDALQILGQFATNEEINVLKQFKTSSNSVFLHSDTSVSPPMLIIIESRLTKYSRLVHASEHKGMGGMELSRIQSLSVKGPTSCISYCEYDIPSWAGDESDGSNTDDPQSLLYSRSNTHTRDLYL